MFTEAQRLGPSSFECWLELGYPRGSYADAWEHGDHDRAWYVPLQPHCSRVPCVRFTRLGLWGTSLRAATMALLSVGLMHGEALISGCRALLLLL